MPQMSPLQWDLLNFNSTILIILICLILFFKISLGSKKNILSMKVIKKISWKW